MGLNTLFARVSHTVSITLPVSFLGVIASAVLWCAKAFGEVGETITFVSNIPGETRTLSVAVYSALQVQGAEASVVRLAVLSVLISIGALIVSEWLARRMTGGRSHVL